DKPIDRVKVLVSGKDKAGEFYRKNFTAMFSYVSNRIPEISNELYKIDDAMKAGFGWENGPFEIWDAIGVEKSLALMEAENQKPALWVTEMLNAGIKSFYTIKDGATYYYDIPSKSYKKVSRQDAFIILDNIRDTNNNWKNNEAEIQDLGDGILNIEFKSKMNSNGSGVLQGINKAIDLAEKDYQGLVIGNQATNFSVGANIAMIFMLA